MTPFPYSVAPDASLAEALRLMEEHGVHHLPVTRDHVVVGLISHRDIIAVRGDAPEDEIVSRVFASDPYVVDLNEPIENVLSTMAARHIGSTVVTRQGRLAGIFTWVDVCRCFADYIRTRFPRGGGDEAA